MVHHHNFNALLALLEGAKRQKLKIDGWLGLTIFNNRVGDLFFSLTARFNPIKRRFTILSCFLTSRTLGKGDEIIRLEGKGLNVVSKEKKLVNYLQLGDIINIETRKIFDSS